jgi:predicted chitinase
MKQFKLITRRINGGYNGLQDRVQKYQNGVSYFTQTG